MTTAEKITNVILLCLSCLLVVVSTSHSNAVCSQTSVGQVPLNDLISKGYTIGGQSYIFDGGLYPEGFNSMTAAHAIEGKRRALYDIKPLCHDGSDVDPCPVPTYECNDGSGFNCCPNGEDSTSCLEPKIVLLSTGMSGTHYEFGAPWALDNFIKLTEANNGRINEKVVIVSGAIPGKAACLWVDPADSCGTYDPYEVVENKRLAEKGVTVNQVQVVWAKHFNTTQSGQTDLISFKDHGLSGIQSDPVVLMRDYGRIARKHQNEFQHLKILLLSSSQYMGYNAGSDFPFSLESANSPVAYETGFSVKWLIDQQIRQNSNVSLPYPFYPQFIDLSDEAGDLNYKTDVAPWISWGPYLWADGSTPRSDFLEWNCCDFWQDDGIHPSDSSLANAPGYEECSAYLASNSGVKKVSSMLYDYFMNSPFSTPWFCADTIDDDHNAASLQSAIQGAIDDENVPDTIMITAKKLKESVEIFSEQDLNYDKTITLDGGYNCDFTCDGDNKDTSGNLCQQQGYVHSARETVIEGQVHIKSGTGGSVNLRNIRITSSL